MNAGLVIEAAAKSDVGMKRTVNEDSYLAATPVFIVADGMGGHSAGDLASAAAVAAFARLPEAGAMLSIEQVEAAIDDARRAVDLVAVGAERGAGCTLTGAVLVEHRGEPYWYVLNVGDSRVYQHRGSSLGQITHDHSLHAELLAAGHEDAATTPRNVITRALGSDDARHDGWLLPVREGTRLLICSDGLTTELDDDELRTVMSAGGSIGQIADEMVRLACEAGGRDNVTVVIVEAVAGGVTGDPVSFETLTDEDDWAESTLENTRPVQR